MAKFVDSTGFIRPVFKVYLLWTLLIFCGSAQAQLIPDSAEIKEAVLDIPDDSLGRRTPRGAVNGFISAVADQNFVRASHYLNIKRTRKSEKERKRIVMIFRNLLDQGGHMLPYAKISNSTSGRTDDDLMPGVDLVGTVSAKGETINIYVENTQGNSAAPVWKFSASTVSAIAAVKGQERFLLIDSIMPEILQSKLLFGAPVGHWIAMLVLIGIAFCLSWAIVFFILYITGVIWRKSAADPTAGVIKALALPVRLYLAVWIFVISSQQTGLSIILRQRFSGITIVIGIVALLILLWRLTDFIGNYSRQRMTSRGRISALSVLLFLRRSAKVAIVVFGAIGILSTLGFDVTTGLAALGIGGIALALGAQKTVENFVGSVTLIADQPIRVGDFCRVGETTGTVEQIGMRSTRIRTGERTIVTIPNGEFSSTRIENFAHRDRLLFTTVLELRYETTADQLRYLLVELRRLLYSHEKVNQDPARVRFIGFGASALRIEVYAYIDTNVFDVFVEVREDLLLRIMDIVESSGTGFAFPSQTLYLSRDKGISDEKTKEAEAKVAQWKGSNTMQIPHFDPEHIKQLKNTIAYPPEGSFKPSK